MIIWIQEIHGLRTWPDRSLDPKLFQNHIPSSHTPHWPLLSLVVAIWFLKFWESPIQYKSIWNKAHTWPMTCNGFAWPWWGFGTWTHAGKLLAIWDLMCLELLWWLEMFGNWAKHCFRGERILQLARKHMYTLSGSRTLNRCILRSNFHIGIKVCGCYLVRFSCFPASTNESYIRKLMLH